MSMPDSRLVEAEKREASSFNDISGGIMKDFCLSLLGADSAQEVNKLLKIHGYLDDLSLWRPVGDNWNNKGTVQNQQADAVSSLVEKITNSIDAVLMDKCLTLGIDPKGPDAPKSFTQAVGRFFLKSETKFLHNLTEFATAKELGSLEKFIFIAATGSKSKPSLTISDRGEGQTPDKFPKTFLSLTGAKELGNYMESIKRQIPFLQGQFGMGGSGAYKYAKYQLLISKRNPKLLPNGHTERDTHWGFTIIRANEDRDENGTIYEYLAPIKADSGSEIGQVLSFSSQSLPIMPELSPTTVPNKPYAQEVEYGTAVKLYEYEFAGTKSNITFQDSLRGQVELAMPRLALPVRGVEAREGYKGSPGSFQTGWFGVLARLEGEYKSSPENFEGDVVKSSFTIEGRRIRWQAFVKKENFDSQNQKGTYALIVHLNGQKHGTKSTTFLRNAKLEILARRNTILIGVDASELTKLQQEKLFMSSRDRFRKDTQFNNDFMQALSMDIRDNEQLQAYQRAQKLREQNNAIEDTSAANELLEKWLRKDPLLSNFFGFGGKISTENPTPPAAGVGIGQNQFVGERFPKVLTFRNKKTEWKQNAQLGKAVRVAMVTDAQNDYLDRDLDCGQIRVWDTETNIEIDDINQSLFNGALNLTFRSLPKKQIGEELQFRIEMTDDSMLSPLVCYLTLSVTAPLDVPSGTEGERSEPNKPNGNEGVNSLLAPPVFFFYHDPKRPREGNYKPWPSDSKWTTRKALEMRLEEGRFEFHVNCDYEGIAAYRNEFPSISHKLVEHRFAWAVGLMCMSAFESFALDSGDKELSGQQEGNIVDRINDSVANRIAKVVLPIHDLLSKLEPQAFEAIEE
jgi:hypothetical protein